MSDKRGLQQWKVNDKIEETTYRKSLQVTGNKKVSLQFPQVFD